MNKLIAMQAVGWPVPHPETILLKRASIHLGIILAAALAGVVAYRLLWFLLLRLARSFAAPLDALMVDRLRKPFLFLLPLLGVMLAVSTLPLPDASREVVNHLFSLCIIVVITWLLINVALLGQDFVLSRFDVQAQDNLKARSIHTQLTLLVKVVLAAITVVSCAIMLMTFDRIHQVGVSILASAGVISIILGFAAQRTLATLFAGLQIAFTQPIRINDVVIVEGEWGWVEEITLTHVVVKIWDLRRMVVPVTYFLEKPFQNWTRVSANLLGSVFLYVDYTAPLDEVRRVFRGLLQASDKWDGRVSAVQVTNCSERTMELRFLMSAPDSPKAFDLRCEVREGLLSYLQNHHPGCLPRLRTELCREGEPPPAR